VAKALGVVRKMDDLGRVVIPMEVRRTLNWEAGAPMEMLATEEGLLIRKYKDINDKKLSVVERLIEIKGQVKNKGQLDVLTEAIEFIKKQ
jgi:AbrB family transcriptional regulator, transcriptional pleiotropic regulator of transition state genes